MSAWEILAPAFAVSVLLILTHTYLGLHVLARGIIFVDIALAQVALFGSSVAFLVGHDAHSLAAHAYAFGAAILAALAFAALRRVPDKVTREVAIGTVYVVATAASVMVLSRSSSGMEELKAMLNGNILWTQWRDVGLLAAIYGVLALLHLAFRRQFYALSFEEDMPTRFRWEALFFVSFAIVITLALDLAGVLLVFAYLIIPAFSASLIVTRFAQRLALGAAFAAAASAVALWLSYIGDLPTGASVVSVLGLLPIVAAVWRAASRRRTVSPRGF